MKNFLLTKIRLSVYFWFFFVVYLIASKEVSGTTFTAGPLTLFSVNSFLYGFYISPILAAQKTRIESLHQIIRSESNALFSIVLHSKKLSKETRNELQALVVAYIRAKLRQRGPNAGEKEYEAIITYCVEYKGKESDQIDKTLEELVANQQNRTNFSMQKANKVFANEWHIMAILFSITLGFILSISIPDKPIMHIVRALLCTGLTMLIVNLIKLNSLTHKKAKQMWQPFKKLVETDFYRID
ncbi:MAG TPA: hypothetical protein VK712_03580 [Verrucomicrobiae bacterium]|jgi:hypothetical protein|nr:hypothetical protein [Verrucomicrobiae bacterium]